MKRAAPKQFVTLVAGTTSDYVEWIRTIDPAGNLFITDPSVRLRAKEPPPGDKEEILCDLADFQAVRASLERHLTDHGLIPDGIACFDCESMDLAAFLAECHALPYPSRQSIGLCRSKHLCKLRWREAGLRCPESENVHSPGEGESFRTRHGGRMVLKPLTGTGSEHVYLCESADDTRTRFELIVSALERKKTDRLYSSAAPARGLVLAEEVIDGEEFSTDFIVAGNQIHPVRLTRKLKAGDRPFGTIHGYVLCNALPEGISEAVFLETLRQSAHCLGIDSAICMLDFFVANNEMALLELAPRPGGDCLPQLLLRAGGIDILKLSLDVARRHCTAPAVAFDGAGPPFMGMKIIAERAGILKDIDTSELEADERVVEIVLSTEPGHVIVLPPEDYDSWILGHIICRLDQDRDFLEQMIELDKKIIIRMDMD